MRELYIAEKPKMAMAIAKNLSGSAKRADGYIEVGGDIAVTWCFGHLYEQAQPDAYDPKYGKWKAADLPIIPSQWKLLPRGDKSVRKQISVIRGLLKRAKTVIHSGDPDREGQLLVDEVLEELCWKGTTKRLWLNALDDGSVKKALAAIRNNTDYSGWKDAAETRSRADWLIGMNLSRSYTLAAQQSNPGVRTGVLSVGRVQSPTLALVVRRDEEIEKFKLKDYLVPVVAVQHIPSGKGFKAVWKPMTEDRPGVDEEGRLLDQSVAEALKKAVTGQNGTIRNFSAKIKKESPPLPWSLSFLQVAASKRFGMSAKQVLDICQSLYEQHKLTSYPRTNCGYLPTSQLTDAPSVIAALKANRPDLASEIGGANLKLKSATWNDSKVTAHHGIVPTSQKANVGNLNPAEAKIYDMIVRAYLVQFYPDHVYEARAADVVVDISAPPIGVLPKETFHATSKQTQSPGWRALWWQASSAGGGATEDRRNKSASSAGCSDQTECEDSFTPLPDMINGDAANVREVELQAKQTRPPARFTEGSLIQAMVDIHRYVENAEVKKRLRGVDGIGTDATRASIIEALIKRGLLLRKGKKQLISSDRARSLVHTLDPHVVDPGITALWESALERIQNGEVQAGQFMTQLEQTVRKLTAAALQKTPTVSAVDAKGGKSRGKGTRSSGAQADGKTYDCPACKTHKLRRISGKNGYFWGCTGYPDCKHTVPDANGKPAKEHGCPVCGGGRLRKRNGKKGAFWGCSSYPKCTATFEDVKGKPDIKGKQRGKVVA